MVNGADLRRKPYLETQIGVANTPVHGRGIQYVEHASGHGAEMFAAVCNLGLEGIVSKRIFNSGRKGLDQVQKPRVSDSHPRWGGNILTNPLADLMGRSAANDLLA